MHFISVMMQLILAILLAINIAGLVAIGVGTCLFGWKEFMMMLLGGL
ncbi:hypothetical protein Eta_0032 [Serratia phage Eta]|uniref:Putative membrane protein n=1 Tax=Serratia phage Eta TaxID=1282995 RepID=R9VWC6_9CAUD|nr:hypothetical protein Eta_0032 [Serratia phage Eta]AGN89478.1 putative membrane protein [Serratia phage Eta]